jgi:DNA-directed RNA polymerase specialized sigma24 family protein
MELLERFAAGDLEAFELLFREHQKEVYAWIVRIVRDHGIAEDFYEKGRPAQAPFSRFSLVRAKR